MALHIAIKNLSTVLTDDEITAALPAFQKQVSNDFRPIWDLDAVLTFLPKNQPVPAGAALIVVLDDADQAGALGYHDLQKNGEPISKVFAKTTAQYGGNWTVTFSHELLEMLVDPYINLTALDDHSGRFYAYEVCDAVEADEFGYMIDGVLVSDFVLPHWFDEHAVKTRVSSFRSHVHGPFKLASGGYISFLDLRTGQWKQITAQLVPTTDGTSRSARDVSMRSHDAIPRPGSRRERRHRGRNGWITSSEE